MDQISHFNAKWIIELQDNNQKAPQMPKKVYSRGQICRFIEKLWSILQNPEYSHILQWNNCGRSFTINNITLLQRDILPLYFRHSQLKSFVRQLNMYDFRKSQRDKQLLVFYNHNFKREQPGRMHLIRRKMAKRESRGEDAEREEIQNEAGNKEIQGNEGFRLEQSGQEMRQDQLEDQPLQIRSFGRFVETDHKLAPLISSFSNRSIPSLPSGQDQPAWQSLQAQFGNPGSTSTQPWGFGFTSCQYFI